MKKPPALDGEQVMRGRRLGSFLADVLLNGSQKENDPL
jgi:hypothetical protein